MASATSGKSSYKATAVPFTEALAPILRPLWASTVGGKALVALTGVVAVAYVIGHLSGNMLLWQGREAINSYAQFLKAKPALLWAVRAFLLAAFVLHVTVALRLNWRNRQARPVRYAHEATVQASWASRHMVLTGLVLLAFVIFHLAHYTWHVVKPAVVVDAQGVEHAINYGDLRERYVENGEVNYRPDVYSMVYYGFRNPVITALYILCMLMLLSHLSHGIGSLFQSLGLSGPRSRPVLARLGVLAAILIGAGNIALPLSVYFGAVPPVPAEQLLAEAGR
jgi:succinate dehydrogenase / fumarate reductase, cytochrome b subunit